MIQKDQQRSNFSRQQNDNQDFIPEFDNIVNIMFGPSSQIANKFCTELGLDRNTFLQFMCNFCIQCANKISTAEL